MLVHVHVTAFYRAVHWLSSSEHTVTYRHCYQKGQNLVRYIILENWRNENSFADWITITEALIAPLVQYSSQVTSRVHALRGTRAREKLARAQGALKELRAKPKPLESWTIANLPARLLLRVLAQSWYSLCIKFTSPYIVTCSYNISVPYTERDCYAGASSRKSSHL